MVEIAVALVPLFLLLGSLLFGHYPGLETIVRLSGRIQARPRACMTEGQRRLRTQHLHSIGGGLLLAFGRAQRPPPLTP